MPTTGLIKVLYLQDVEFAGKRQSMVLTWERDQGILSVDTAKRMRLLQLLLRNTEVVEQSAKK